MPSRGLSTRLEQRNMKTLVAAIHGIMTRQTNPSWPDRLDAWFAARSPGMRVLKKEYSAGPWPRWNCAVKNPRLALGLVNEIRLMLDAPGGAEPAPSVWIVAHSNGALVALSAARRLARAGHPVSGLILIGAAVIMGLILVPWSEVEEFDREDIIDWKLINRLSNKGE